MLTMYVYLNCMSMIISKRRNSILIIKQHEKAHISYHHPRVLLYVFLRKFEFLTCEKTAQTITHYCNLI